MLGKGKKPGRFWVRNKSRYADFEDFVIRTSNHLPKPNNLIQGDVTGARKNIYLIIVKSFIDLTSIDGQEFDELMHSAESNDLEEREFFAGVISDIGKSAGKNIAYKIVDDIDLDGLKILEEKINFRVKNFGFKPGQDEYDYEEPD